MPYGFYYNDPMLLPMIILIVVSLITSSTVKSTFNKYYKKPLMRNLTGRDAAELMLKSNGISNVSINMIGGTLTDHYNPKSRSVNLSERVYNGRSVASVAVACHECGHAVQHAESYVPLAIRSMFFPAASFGSSLGIPLFIGGMLFSFKPLMTIGILVFSAAVLFQIVTLPVEFNASHRAIKMMNNEGLLDDTEIIGAKKVLGAAAMTYVASAAMAVVQLLRLILLSRSRD